MNLRIVVAVLMLVVASNTAVNAMTLRTFRQLSSQEQATLITGAVSMLAYTYAANGNVAAASCIKQWYFGSDAPGPRELAVEIAAAEKTGTSDLAIEGIVLGLAEQRCVGSQPKP